MPDLRRVDGYRLSRSTDRHASGDDLAVVRDWMKLTVLAHICQLDYEVLLLAVGIQHLIHCKNLSFAFVARSEVDRMRIDWSPREFIHPVVELRQQILDGLRFAVVEHQAKLVAFVARAGLGAPGDVLAVGGVGGVEVAAG